jgi:hypothetical protein
MCTSYVRPTKRLGNKLRWAVSMMCEHHLNGPDARPFPTSGSVWFRLLAVISMHGCPGRMVRRTIARFCSNLSHRCRLSGVPSVGMETRRMLVRHRGAASMIGWIDPGELRRSNDRVRIKWETGVVLHRLDTITN